MKIEITGDPKEIAALVLAVQAQQEKVFNQLVLDTVNNAPVMQN